jgi:DDE superfamily endonuclease
MCDDICMSAPGERSVVVYDGAVARADLDVWESELESVFARMRPLFYRTESRKHAKQYVRGLLSPIARKNGWTIAEYVGEREPKALQRLLNLTPWDADALVKVNREYAMEQLADPGAVLVADSTGFPKKGTRSVGVQRQYSGTLGRIDNCQITTFLSTVCDPGSGPGSHRSATVSAPRVLDGRSGALRGCWGPARGRLRDQASAGHRDDPGSPRGRRAVRLVHRG